MFLPLGVPLTLSQCLVLTGLVFCPILDARFYTDHLYLIIWLWQCLQWCTLLPLWWLTASPCSSSRRWIYPDRVHIKHAEFATPLLCQLVLWIMTLFFLAGHDKLNSDSLMLLLVEWEEMMFWVVASGCIACVDSRQRQLLPQVELQQVLVLGAAARQEIDLATTSLVEQLAIAVPLINNTETCSICLVALTISCRACGKCKNAFHEECIQRWVLQKITENRAQAIIPINQVSCPLCRAQLV